MTTIQPPPPSSSSSSPLPSTSVVEVSECTTRTYIDDEEEEDAKDDDTNHQNENPKKNDTTTTTTTTTRLPLRQRSIWSMTDVIQWVRTNELQRIRVNIVAAVGDSSRKSHIHRTNTASSSSTSSSDPPRQQRPFLLVTGPTGSGKRPLIQHALTDLEETTGTDTTGSRSSGSYRTCCCFGSFDNHKATIYHHHSHHQNPFGALQRVLTDFVHQLQWNQRQRRRRKRGRRNTCSRENQIHIGHENTHHSDSNNHDHNDKDDIVDDHDHDFVRILLHLQRAIQSVEMTEPERQALEQLAPALRILFLKKKKKKNDLTDDDDDDDDDQDNNAAAAEHRHLYPNHTTTETIQEDDNGGIDTSLKDRTTTANNNNTTITTHHPQQHHFHPNIMTQQQRLCQALVKFCTAISLAITSSSSSSSSQPTPPPPNESYHFGFTDVVFVLGDLQYADPVAVDVLTHLLPQLPPHVHVMATYVGSSFDDASHHEHNHTAATTSSSSDPHPNIPRSYLVDRMRDLERNYPDTFSIQTIPIRNLNETQVTFVLHQMLQQQCASLIDLPTDELTSVVMEETHGNIFLITEFLHWLYQNQLLRVNRPSNCHSDSFTYWAWDINEIHASIATATASTLHNHHSNPHTFETKFYLAQKLDALPTLMLDVLKVGACLGSSYFEATLVEYVLNGPIQSTIHDLVDQVGILESIGHDGQRYSFVHDEMQNAAYHLIPETNRELFHLEIGRRMWRRLPRHDMDQYLFVILSQFHMGRRLITRPTERYHIATLCLHAGHKAAKSSTFHSSLVYLNFGIELLGESGWRDEYDLSLKVHQAAAEMELCHTNYQGMKSLVETVVRCSRCVDDTIPAQTTLLHGLLVNDQQQQGLDLGRELLAVLGFGLPRHLTSLYFWWEMTTVQRLLKGKSNEYLKRLPVITNEKVLASMHILNLMSVHAMLETPELAPFIVVKMMLLTLRHGLSFISPQVFGIFGMLCIQAKADRDMGFRFGELALELIETMQVHEYIPRVYATYYACIHPWKYPVRDSLDRLIYAHRIGSQTGDIEFSYMCASLWYLQAYDIGIPLDEIETRWAYLQISLRSWRLQPMQNVILPHTMYIKFHRGEDVDLGELDVLLQNTVKNGQHTAQMYLLWSKAEVALFYNDIEQADMIVSSGGLVSSFWKMIQSHDIVNLTFVSGMIAFVCLNKAYKGKRQQSRRQYLREGNSALRSLQKYSRWCPANFIHKKLLLEAERAASFGQIDLTIEKYICAIGTAREHRSLVTLAWANERFGRYYFNALKRHDDAIPLFNQALLLYEEWKGQRKVEHLRVELMGMYGEDKYKEKFMVSAS